jgi:hypothetical protein
MNYLIRTFLVWLHFADKSAVAAINLVLLVRQASFEVGPQGNHKGLPVPETVWLAAQMNFDALLRLLSDLNCSFALSYPWNCSTG